MSQEKKERVGILMLPSQVAEIDALYPLHGHASRSDFVCKAVEFYTDFLQQGSSEFYMNKTTLAFLEEQLGTRDFEVLPKNRLRLYTFLDQPQTVNRVLLEHGVGLISAQGEFLTEEELDEEQQEWILTYETLNYCGMVDLFDEARPMYCLD